MKAHCLPREYTLKRSLPWCILAERNNSIITCKCQRVFVYALDQNQWPKLDRMEIEGRWVRILKSIYFSLIPLVLLTASPPEKRHPHRPTDRMTEIEILEDIYVAQVASLFAGVVKNSVLPRWRSAAIKWTYLKKNLQHYKCEVRERL